MRNYRKIWIKFNGPIPLDEEGRTFDIHHIDGNRKNNDADNLEALSMRDHYWKHLLQGDYWAAFMIEERIKGNHINNFSVVNKKCKKEMNPFWGKTHTPEVRKHISDKISGENHPFYGKKRPEHSKKMKIIMKGIVRSEEHKKNLRKALLDRAATNPPRAGTWIVAKNGNEQVVKNLKKFCREEQISYTKLFYSKKSGDFILVGKAK
jgi:hypothetical protein